LLWEQKGRHNTAATVKAALQKAAELNIEYLVVASNSGETAAQFAGNKKKIIWVTHHHGFQSPGESEINPEIKEKLLQQGVKILTTTHLLAGVDRALRLKFGGLYTAEIIASSLRILGEGVKVCVEISVMALDAGMIPYGEEVIAVAGSSRGADAACVLLPAHANNFFETRVQEIICMPRGK
jgi:hypothetical protein